SKSPGVMSLSRNTAGSHFTRSGVTDVASAAPVNSTFTVKGVFGPTETMPGVNVTRVPAPSGSGMGANPGTPGFAGCTGNGTVGGPTGWPGAAPTVGPGPGTTAAPGFGARAGLSGAGLAGAEPPSSRGAYIKRSD